MIHGPWTESTTFSFFFASHKIAPKLQNSIFFNHNSKSSDSCAKILRIISSFILSIHLTHVCCIMLIDYMHLLRIR
jgi:hypothetical protein